MKNVTFISVFTVLCVVSCGKQMKFQPKIVSAELIEVNVTERSKNNEMSQWLVPYKTTFDNVMNIKIGDSEQELPLSFTETESLLGNFIADVMIDFAKMHGKKIDFAITNKGGLRGYLPEGAVTVGDVYAIFPFDNELVIITLSGKKVEQLCQEIAKQKGQVTHGISMQIVDEKGINIQISGSPLDVAKNYQVLTTDYLSFGNDKLFALADYTDILPLGKPLREAIMEYIKKEHKNGRKINAKLKNEVVIASTFAS